MQSVDFAEQIRDAPWGGVHICSGRSGFKGLISQEQLALYIV